jgi:hypothetical protein
MLRSMMPRLALSLSPRSCPSVSASDGVRAGNPIYFGRRPRHASHVCHADHRDEAAQLSRQVAFWQGSLHRPRPLLICPRFIQIGETHGSPLGCHPTLPAVCAARGPRAGGLGPWAAQEKGEDVQSIRLVLNELELVSIGIQRGIIDFELYKLWRRSGVIRFWNYSSPFVIALPARLNNDSIYHEFEAMVGWMRDNRMPRKHRWRFWS